MVEVAAYPDAPSQRDRALSAIHDPGVLVIARLGGTRSVEVAAAASRQAGIRAFEVTLDTPSALEWIRSARARFGRDFVIGAGTVTTVEEARAALDAGAEFLVSPFLETDVLACANDRGVLALPGTFTTTEIARAMRSGAVAVKLFPASVGPTYVQQVTAPLRSARIIPTGGIHARSAASFIAAGAFAVGIGAAVLDAELLRREDVGGLVSALGAVVAAVADARHQAER